MANKKISQLDSRASLSLSDLMAVGDPSTGYLYKTTISDLKTLTGAGVISFNGRFGAVSPAEGDYTLNQLGDVIITSPSNNQVLQYNGSNWVNATLPAETDTLNSVTTRGNTTSNGITVGSIVAGTTAAQAYHAFYSSNVNDGNTVTISAENLSANSSRSQLLLTDTSGGASKRFGLGVYTGVDPYSYLDASTKLVFQQGGGNMIVGGITDAGYKFDVVGTARVQGNLTLSSASNLITANGFYGLATNYTDAIFVGWDTSAVYLGYQMGALPIEIGTNGTGQIRFRNTGGVKVESLAGTGSRMVIVDANGVMSTQAIPTGSVTSVFGRTGAVVAASGDYTTSQVTEGTNLYFTDARARAAISLTTTGTSGAATYVGGVLNIPNYSTDLSGYVTLGTAQTISGAKVFSNSLRMATASPSIQAYAADNTTYYGALFINNIYYQFTAAVAGSQWLFKNSAGDNVVTIGHTGALTAASIARAGGTSSQFLKADGSVDSSTYQTALTNPVTGTGTTNRLPVFTGSSTIGNSNIYISGNSVGINQPTVNTGFALDVLSTDASYNTRFYQPSTATNTYNSILISGAMTAAIGYFGIGGSTTGNTSFRNSVVIGSQSAHDLVLNTADVERVRISGSSGAATFSGLFKITSGSGTKAVWETTRNFGVNRNFQIAVDEYQEGEFTITPSTSIGGSGFASPIFRLGATGIASFSNSVTAKGIVVVGASGGYTTGDNTFINLGGASGADSFGAINAPYGDRMRFNSYHGFEWYTANGGASGVPVSKMLLTSQGSLLIATTSGVSGGGALQVNGDVNINGNFKINGTTIGGGGGSGVTGSGTNGYFTKWTGASTLGNSGINEDGGGFQLYGGSSSGQSSTASPKYIRFNNDYSTGATDASLKLYLFNSGATIQGFTSGPSYDIQYHTSGSDSGRHAFYVGNVESMRINKTTVLIGTATDLGGAYRLQVNGGISMAFGYLFNFKGSGSDVVLTNSGSTLSISGGNLSVSGSVTATAFFESSDIRFKNVLEYNPSVNVSGIDVIKFTRHSDSQIRYGYSAQQVQSIFPDAVIGKDELVVNYIDIHTLKIAALEKEVAELKAKLN